MSFKYQVNNIRTETYSFQTEPFRDLDKTENQKKIFEIPDGEVK